MALDVCYSLPFFTQCTSMHLLTPTINLNSKNILLTYSNSKLPLTPEQAVYRLSCLSLLSGGAVWANLLSNHDASSQSTVWADNQNSKRVSSLEWLWSTCDLQWITESCLPYQHKEIAWGTQNSMREQADAKHLSQCCITPLWLHLANPALNLNWADHLVIDVTIAHKYSVTWCNMTL